jgi:hypothetical protein
MLTFKQLLTLIITFFILLTLFVAFVFPGMYRYAKAGPYQIKINRYTGTTYMLDYHTGKWNNVKDK